MLTKKGEIANKILIAGDPLRARWVAKKFLNNVVQFNKVRNALGFTGMDKNNKRVSVMGTGMGMLTTAIYTNELIDFYNVKKIIRIGSCGSLQKNRVNLRDIILVQGSCFDSSINTKFFKGIGFAPLADFNLLYKAFNIAKQLLIPVKVGNNLSVDDFYDNDTWKVFAKYNVLTVEMETAKIYQIASIKNIQALSILTVSDIVETLEGLNAKEREQSFSKMIKLALEL